MGTHRTQCVVCERPTWCTSDSHWLGAQGCCYGDAPSIEFCSMPCFRKLYEAMTMRLKLVVEEARRGDNEARRLVEETSPAPEPVAPAGAVFQAYPKDIAAYLDDEDCVIVRCRYFYSSTAREFAAWILENVPDEEGT